ncbi:tRNA(Glu)-specific nuclease WapA (plasmid) [Paraglaciecola mesophila]|uniref:tRNA(Glu)-specific nuclease WapA n=1 Tax=Paraglaciecola mesophila TaxID=197222 RepID=A0A857JSQ1_9ALTE|nr:RHS repeat-associated core domain-containing protein [Paraglaciecola mesophila]QHJ14007.1 tRNA(Glu)-specific nuclease WapA [Paraglaciecola mesophila]
MILDTSACSGPRWHFNNLTKYKLQQFNKIVFALFFSILSLISSSVVADDEDDSVAMEAEFATTYDLSRDEFDSRLKPLDFNLMGDSIDISSGAISFSITDVSLPGNSELEVAFRRRANEAQVSHNPRESGRRVYQPLADWTLDIPSVSTFRFRSGDEQMGVISDAGCFNTGDILVDESEHIAPHSTYVSQLALSGGVTINLPGGRSEQIVLTSLSASGERWASINDSEFLGASKYYSTLHCRGAYSEVTTKDGIKYFITKKVLLPATDIESYSRSSTFSFQNFNRYKEIHLATRAQDIHGNTVDWTYDSMGRLTKISSNDGRTIDVNYLGTSRHVSTVVANGRTWRYNYTTVTYSDTGGVFYSDEDRSGETTVLASVTQPDGKRWEYDISNLTNSRVFNRVSMSARVIAVTHPYGAQAEFELESKLQDVSAIDVDDYNRISVRRNNLSLIRKTITGPQLPTSVWTYDYEEPVIDSKGEGDFGVDLKRVTKTSPDGGFTEYFTFPPKNGNPVGEVQVEKVFSTQNGSLLRQTEYEFVISQPFGEIGSDTYTAGSFDHYLVEKTIKQNSDTYTSEFEYETDPSEENYSYGQPIVIKRFSNLPDRTTRKISHTYENIKSKWLLGLVSTSSFNDKLYYEYDYDSTGRLLSIDSFGADTIDYTYYTSGQQGGLVSTSTDGIGRVTKYLDYYRGIPKTVIRAFGTADSISTEREVDENGWITGVRDGKGQKDVVLRDSMGRITQIDPYGDWYNTNISYEFSNAAGMIQNIQRNEHKLTITYDGLLRTVLEKNEDLVNGWFAYKNTKFDSTGREVFSSYPSISPTHTLGVKFEYDVLGRVKREIQYPSIITTYDYLTDNKTITTDPDGFQTTTRKSGYGNANDGEVLFIESPESTTTQMSYDNWGNLSTLRRFGNQDSYSVDESHKYFYDFRMRLCRHQGDETGSKLIAYDNANQITMYSEGQASGNSCAAPDAGKISLTYDNLGQLTKTDFSDVTPDITRTYDDNGNILQINRGSTRWSYQYFDNDMIRTENLNIDGLNFKTSYDRDLSGHISKIIYPSGDAISQSPDALGRPTNLTGSNIAYSDVYASNVQYNLNHSLKSFDYGNGVQFTQGVNNRLLPDHLSVWHGSGGSRVNILDYQYTYDGRGNTVNINDGVNDSRSVSNTYDGLSRLVTSSSAFGDITFKYDAVGNLRKRSVIGGDALGGPQHNATMSFNSNNQVSNVTTIAGVRSFDYDTRGNVTNNGIYTFNYDLANQPIKSGPHSFVYDGNFKRAKKIVDGEVLYFVYTKSAGLVSHYNRTSSIHTDHIRLGKQLVARVESAGSYADYYQTTPFNDTLDDQPNQGLTGRDNYLPFGKSISNENISNRAIGFTGHVKDKSGLIYMQARYYDPVIGRFYSNDPVDFMGHLQRGNSPAHGFGRYTYANNNPYKYTDPNGEFAFLAWFATPPGIAALQYTGTALLGIMGGVAIHENVVEPMMNESSDSENKGQTKPEVGDCPACGGDTSNKPGKIGDAHGLKPKEVKEAIHGVKGNANLPGNPDVEVCNDCGEVFPQTEDGGLGDSIGNIEDEKGNR